MSRGVVGLVGAGAVGPVILKALAAAGWTAGVVASRTRGSAESAVAYAGGTAGSANPDAARDADLLVIAVPDRAIAAVAAEVAPVVRPGSLAIHLSGAHSSDLLSPVREAGADTGSLHPLQSFADREVAYRCLSATFHFYEGSDAGRVRGVAADLGGRPVPIDGAGKALYHAGAAAACNLAVAMVDVGVRLMESAGIDRDDALAALLPLLRGTVGNLEAVGLPAALTGPVARGDAETVARHIEEMRRATPELADAYAEASRHAVRIALEKGTIDEAAAKGLRSVLTPPRP